MVENLVQYSESRVSGPILLSMISKLQQAQTLPSPAPLIYLA
jgi:hypothetical protein